MKNSLLLLILLAIIPLNLLYSNTSSLNPDEYMVKQNDIFVFESTLMIPNNASQLMEDKKMSQTAQTIQSKVSPSGVLSLFPFADSVLVSGKTLSKVYSDIDAKFKLKFKTNAVTYYLAYISPINFNVTGMVVKPGAYVSEEIPTLCQALVLAGGTGASSSKVITIKRNKKSETFDLKKYLNDGDVSQNPLIYNDDVIIVKPASNFIKVFTNNDTINYVESVELSDNSKISDILKVLFKKHQWSNLDKFSVSRNNEYLMADQSFELKANDKLFIPVEELYIYVTGHVAKPGRYVYNGSNDVSYYIAQAGGQINTGSRSTVYIIDKIGTKYKYTGQPLKQGDILYVPESLKSTLISYLAPVSTVISVISTIVLININIKNN